MFNFYNLFSSSSGNCSYIETESTKLLIDCGLSAKKIEESLNKLNSSLSQINAILITHEHSDHIKALKTICKKYNIPVYANKKTHYAISKNTEISNKKYFLNDDAFDLGELKIKAFSIPHDAANPVAYNIANSNKKISIATDIGHIDKNLINNLTGSSFILLESNYDLELLKNSKYPYNLKQRIAGPFGHLSNDNTAELVDYLTTLNLNNVMFGHLSSENNTPEQAYQTTINKLMNKNLQDFTLQIANRSEISKKIILDN